MVSAIEGSGLSPGWGHCVLFLGKTLYFQGVSRNPGKQMDTVEFNVGGNPAMD